MNGMLLAAANGEWSVAGDLAAKILEQESDNVTVRTVPIKTLDRRGLSGALFCFSVGGE